MITITIPASEQWDPVKGQFIYIAKDTTINLEHSLLSISKWESKTHKPFLSTENKTVDEVIEYIRCMCMTPGVDPLVFNGLTQENVEEITKYINDPMTATWINDKSGKKSREIVTSELIYYWMIALNIPMECQKWHINRLLTLIRVCNVKNTPPKKMNKREIASRYASLNAARRKQFNSRG